MAKTAKPSTDGNGQSCQSYLLRLQNEDTCGWLASLQDARTGERYRFTTLADLFAFVEVKAKEVKE
jgi:hypothetical protein